MLKYVAIHLVSRPNSAGDSGTIRRIDYPPSLKKLRRAGEEEDDDEDES